VLDMRRIVPGIQAAVSHQDQEQDRQEQQRPHGQCRRQDLAQPPHRDTPAGPGQMLQDDEKQRTQRQPEAEAETDQIGQQKPREPVAQGKACQKAQKQASHTHRRQPPCPADRRGAQAGHLTD